MLDYYDRCYDHELRDHCVKPAPLGNLSPEAAARWLLEQGWIQPGRTLRGEA